MARIDWSPDTSGLPVPGIYPAEVHSVEEKKSKKPPYSTYLKVKLVSIETRDTLCYDMIMLEGKGRGMGQRKLRVLGVDETTQEIDPASLVGRRAFVAIIHEPYGDRLQAKVDGYAETSICGYWPYDGPPPPGTIADETPF